MSPQIVGLEVTKGATEGGCQAMENILQKADHIDLVYAINGVAYGGYAPLKAAGKEQGVIFVAVDGGCQGVKWVKEGKLGATSQQYPLSNGGGRRPGGGGLHQDRQEADEHVHR